jgi:Ring finger domain
MNSQLNTFLTDLAYSRAVFFRTARTNTQVQLFLENEKSLIRMFQSNTIAVAINTLFLPGHEDVVVGLTSAQIENFTENVTVVNSSQEVCAICQDSLHLQPSCRIRSCSHRLHKQCANQWFTMSVRCPICRVDLRETPETINNNV